MFIDYNIKVKYSETFYKNKQTSKHKTNKNVFNALQIQNVKFT